MLQYYPDIAQGSELWMEIRCGLLTASEMKNIITPKKLEYAQNDKEKAHLYELAAQRITKYVEPHYINDDMMRGKDDEIYARAKYMENYARVEQVGFITNDKWGFTLGFSPDGLVGADGIIEGKSRRQKFQIEAIVTDQVPEEYIIQIQTGLLVSERLWCDYISYSGGMHMYTTRVYADLGVQAAIVEAATIFHNKLEKVIAIYKERLEVPDARLIQTERRNYEDIRI